VKVLGFVSSALERTILMTRRHTNIFHLNLKVHDRLAIKIWGFAQRVTGNGVMGV